MHALRAPSSPLLASGAHEVLGRPIRHALKQPLSAEASRDPPRFRIDWNDFYGFVARVFREIRRWLFAGQWLDAAASHSDLA